MPLVAAAFCPHPPLLVPEIAAGAAAELAGCRAAADSAVRSLAAAGAAAVVLVGDAPATAVLPSPWRGSFAAWGVSIEVAAPAPTGARAVAPVRAGWVDAPLSLLIGAWLVARSPGVAAIRSFGVATDASPADCQRFGAGLVDRAPDVAPWGLLVLGDGAACHGVGAPGYADPRAPGYDDSVAGALAAADTSALAALDPALSAELRVAGRAPWQVLAGAVAATGVPWRGELRYRAAPYGVGYLVAEWRRR